MIWKISSFQSSTECKNWILLLTFDIAEASQATSSSQPLKISCDWTFNYSKKSSAVHGCLDPPIYAWNDLWRSSSIAITLCISYRIIGYELLSYKWCAASWNFKLSADFFLPVNSHAFPDLVFAKLLILLLISSIATLIILRYI